VQAEVHSLLSIHPDYFLQRFTSPPLVFQPGQFVMVKPSGSLDPFLPRAYSILRAQRLSNGRRAQRANVVEILYKVLGKGTTALSQLRPGDRVDLLGPLGHGYHVPPDLTTALLVAGGIGVPPVVALAERLASLGTSARPSTELGRAIQGSGKGKSGRRTSDVGHRRIVAFVGGKSSADVLCLTDLRKAGAALHVATEDGSLGHHGLVTDLLEAHIKSRAAKQQPTIFACGPHPMLHAVARIAEQYEIPCQVSLEAAMACGFGACMGCVIPVHSSPFSVHGNQESVNREPLTVNQRSYKLCCKDGPVFDAREIAW
jgi:dihydroorotate dehydrogenase electron transfer subunit